MDIMKKILAIVMLAFISIVIIKAQAPWPILEQIISQKIMVLVRQSNITME